MSVFNLIYVFSDQVTNFTVVDFLFLICFLTLTIVSVGAIRQHMEKEKEADSTTSDFTYTPSSDEVAKKCIRLKAELEAAEMAKMNLRTLLHNHRKNTENQQKHMLDYLFLNAHQIRGPLARILGIISLFDKDAVLTHEKEFLLGELKNSANELDQQIRKANEILHNNLESPLQNITLEDNLPSL